MKKSILIALFVMCANLLNAQVSAGTIFLGGNLGFSSSGGKNTFKSSSTTVETKKPNTTTFYISPGFGYVFSDNMAAGLNIGFTSTTTKEDSTNFSDKTSSSMFSVNPFFRYYLMLEDNFGFTGTLNVNFYSEKSKSETKLGNTTISSEGPQYSGLSVGITPGIIFFPSSKIGIEGNIGFLGYSSTTKKTKSSNSERTDVTSEFGLNVGSFRPAFNVGFYYYLGGE